MSIRAVGVDSEQLRKSILRPRWKFLLKINRPEAVIRDCVPRIQRNHALHFRRGIFEIALRAVSTRQSPVSSGEVRPQPYGFPKLPNRFVRLPFVEKCDTVLRMD